MLAQTILQEVKAGRSSTGAGVATWASICPRAINTARALDTMDAPRKLPAVFEPQQLEAASGLSRRELKKLDRFSVLAIAAARSALAGSVLSPQEWNRCGVFTGNMVGGWTFTEGQLRNLHRAGPSEVSPYLATAWFPAAPQGQITIHFRMKGFSKTISTDRCAGAQAIGLASELIGEGKCDVLLAGGAEAPCTPFVEAAPASYWTGNAELTEAAAYLLLAPSGDSRITVSGHSTFACRCNEPGFYDRLRFHLSGSAVQDMPALLVCNVPAVSRLRDAVCECTQDVFGCIPETIFPTDLLGDSLGASGAVSAVVACERLQELPAGSVALLVSCGHQCCDLLWFRRT
jgi:hypothetical protein